jgi:hypothetical protein
MSAIRGRTNPPLCSIMDRVAATVNMRAALMVPLPLEVCPSETDCPTFTWEYASINHHDEPCVRFSIIQQNGDDWIN